MLNEDAMRYLTSLAAPVVYDVGGRPYTSGKVYAVNDPVADPLKVKTLSALADYIHANHDGLPYGEIFVHVLDEKTVKLRSALVGEFKLRPTFICASPVETETFPFNEHHSMERLIPALQAYFVHTDALKALLAFLASVTQESVISQEDDGMTQEVTVREGIRRSGRACPPNPVSLAPYRTFPEIEQPESPFVFRLQKDPIKGVLIPADGGAWKVEAMKRIKAWLLKNLPQGITVLA